MQKLFYILVCDGTNSYVDPMLLSTYCITDAQHELFLDFSTSATFLVCSTLVTIPITWHMNISELLSTYYVLAFSAPTMARHLLKFYLSIHCVLYIHNENGKCVDTHFSILFI